MQTYPGYTGAVNITVRNSEVFYMFQVRASNLVNEIQNHGEFSEVTSESTVFVPSGGNLTCQWLQLLTSSFSTVTCFMLISKVLTHLLTYIHLLLDLPVPRNVQFVQSTNSTASLTWDYPTPPHDPIIRFQVSIRGRYCSIERTFLWKSIL